MGWPDPPFRGLVIGSLVFLLIMVFAVVVVSIVFRNGQTCYANNFAIILIVMSYIMWACTYMCQMFPLVQPEYAGSE
jgi:phosphoglycerol transferase MdoB-like AlkP superfamily enzyme